MMPDIPQPALDYGWPALVVFATGLVAWLVLRHDKAKLEFAERLRKRLAVLESDFRAAHATGNWPEYERIAAKIAAVRRKAKAAGIALALALLACGAGCGATVRVEAGDDFMSAGAPGTVLTVPDYPGKARAWFLVTDLWIADRIGVPVDE